MTTGILLQRLRHDPLLEENGRVDVVIIDEMHERSWQQDVSYGILRELQEIRPELRILILSATLIRQPFTQQSPADVAIHKRGALLCCGYSDIVPACLSERS